MTSWIVDQATSGTSAGVFHSHSYYDIRVFDQDSRYLVAHRMTMTERRPSATDTIEVGIVDLDNGYRWATIGSSRAWSWQQGPMAQWLPSSRRVVWNDREGSRFVTRIYDMNTGTTRLLGRPSYAVDPNDRFTLSLNMARLEALRPGYGYAGGEGAHLSKSHPRDDGVWYQPLDGGKSSLVLSLDKAVRHFYRHLGVRTALKQRLARYRYWFNHVKISPDGKRFTIKLRYRAIGDQDGWNDTMGVSLTCGTEGEDLRILSNATSHVIWLDAHRLYLWRRDGVYLYADKSPRGQQLRQIAPNLIAQNVHLRHMPGSSRYFVFDTPYQEQIDLYMLDEQAQAIERIARFENHVPKRGEYRCDLHPCPSPDGEKIVVTSLHDGGRQIYILRRS